MHCYNSYKHNLPRIAREEVEHPRRDKWMWFEAPNKKELLECIKRAKGEDISYTPIKKIPIDCSSLKVKMGIYPWLGVSIKREIVKISERLFVKVWLSEKVFYMSHILFWDDARFLEIVEQ